MVVQLLSNLIQGSQDKSGLVRNDGYLDGSELLDHLVDLLLETVDLLHSATELLHRLPL